MKKLLFILLSIQLLFASSEKELNSDETINTSIKKAEKHYYTISIPKNKSIRVKLTELEADIDLYVKKGNEVRLRFNDCYSSNSNTENEECVLTNDGETSNYTILVYGFKASSYTLKATIEGAEEIPILTDDTIADEVAHKEEKLYKLSGKEGKVITVTLSDLTADADLRVKVGTKAGLHNFDCKSTNGGTKVDACSITPKKDSTIYVHVYGYKHASYSLKATSEVENVCLSIEELKSKIKNNEDITQVNTSCITNMDYLFNWHREFNQNISGWDVSNVTSMNHMFTNADSFNQDLSSWNVSNVEKMNNMFSYTPSFKNHDLSNWDVSNVSAKKYFLAMQGEGNTAPIWKELDTVLINRAKKYCQNVHNESDHLICSDVDDSVYIINNENDIGSSPWIYSKTYVVQKTNGQENI